MELEIAITEARKSPLVSTVGKDEVMKMITAGVSHSAMVRGQDISLNGKAFIASEVYDEVFNKHPDIRVEEIPIVFRNGVYGRYGDYFGVNALTIVGWFESYLASDERYNVRQKEKVAMAQRQIVHDVSPEVEQRRNDEAMRSSALEFYRQSKENGGRVEALVMLKAYVFDYLVNVGKIKNADERIAAALEEEKERVRKGSSKISKGMNQMSGLMDIISTMGDKSLVPQAKARVLDKFYKALYETGRELHL
jgi:hypothetical protein